jgi:hypothetical protein
MCVAEHTIGRRRIEFAGQRDDRDTVFGAEFDQAQEGLRVGPLGMKSIR